MSSVVPGETVQLKFDTRGECTCSTPTDRPGTRNRQPAGKLRTALPAEMAQPLMPADSVIASVTRRWKIR